MEKNIEIKDLLNSQKKYFFAGGTRSIERRIKFLKKLYAEIKKREGEINKALEEDLGKSAPEAYMSEIGLCLSEIAWQIKNIYRLSKEKVVKTPIAQFASRSYAKAVPLGSVLIISPWNYPFLLSLTPLTEAVAAGNTVVLKASSHSPKSSRVIKKLISAVFPKEWVYVSDLDRTRSENFLDQKWNKIFFTGSGRTGKEILKKAAENLTPVTLELGGKSPCIVDKTAKIELAAKRIVFGKFLNCGQTCVAPDYILCHEDIKDKLIIAIIRQIKLQYGENPLNNPAYGKIISKNHFDRIRGLIDPKKVATGGEADEKTLKIAPTVLDRVSFDDPVMKEEIFGPLLPVLTFDMVQNIPKFFKNKPSPLAFYIFSERREVARYLIDKCQFGGGCINDCVIHLATTELPFGGIGESGMGAYHGEKGFYTFSHVKSIVDKKTWMDMPMRYQPYKNIYNAMVKLFIH